MGSTALTCEVTSDEDFNELVDLLGQMKRLQDLDITLKSLTSTQAQALIAKLTYNFTRLSISIEDCDQEAGKSMLEMFKGLHGTPEIHVKLKEYEQDSLDKLKDEHDTELAKFQRQYITPDAVVATTDALTNLMDEASALAGNVSDSVSHLVTQMGSMQLSRMIPAMPSFGSFNCLATCMPPNEEEQERRRVKKDA
jgi:hypothetical protein